MVLYVGVDWSATEAVCESVTPDGKFRRLGTVAARRDAVRALVEGVRTAEVTEVRVVVESGQSFWSEAFHAAGAVVCVVDAKQASRFGEALSSSHAKDDQRDARVLAELGRVRSSALRVWTPDPRAMKSLRSWLQRHEQRTTDQTRVVQQLRERMRATMPLVDDVIEDMSGQWALRLVAAVPTAWHAATLTTDAFERLMTGTRKATRQKVWAALQASRAAEMDEFEAADLGEAIQLDVELLRRLHVELETMGQRIRTALAAIPTAAELNAIHGLGTHLTAALLVYGKLGSPDRDASARQMGAAPVFRGSARRADGRPKGGATLRRSASAGGRRTTHLLGRSLVRNVGWAKAQFKSVMARTKKAAMAYRVVVRSFLRIVNAMVRDGTPYDESKYVARLKATGVGWASAL